MFAAAAGLAQGFKPLAACTQMGDGEAMPSLRWAPHRAASDPCPKKHEEARRGLWARVRKRASKFCFQPKARLPLPSYSSLARRTRTKETRRDGIMPPARRAAAAPAPAMMQLGLGGGGRGGSGRGGSGRGAGRKSSKNNGLGAGTPTGTQVDLASLLGAKRSPDG